MSILFAVILWLFVMENENPTIERDFTVPIEVANSTNDYDYTLSKRNVRIKVFAKRIYFATLDPGKIRSTIDLSEAGTSGEFEAPILTELPTGYEYIEKSEDKVKVTLDPYVTVPVTVDIKERGSSQDIARVSALIKTESMLEIRGVAKNTAKVAKLIGYVDLIGKDTDFEQEVILIPVDTAGSEVQGVEVVRPTTLVKVDMKASMTTKTVPVKPVLNDKNMEHKAVATPAFVEISGEDGVIADISEIATETLIFGSENTFQAKLVLPEGVTSKIQTVMVRVKK